MRFALAAVALLSLAGPAAAHVTLGYGGPCSDDGLIHHHENGFSACTSIPSACPAPGLPCTPYICISGDDVGHTQLWECRDLLPPVPSAGSPPG